MHAQIKKKKINLIRRVSLYYTQIQNNFYVYIHRFILSYISRKKEEKKTRKKIMSILMYKIILMERKI